MNIFLKLGFCIPKFTPLLLNCVISTLVNICTSKPKYKTPDPKAGNNKNIL